MASNLSRLVVAVLAVVLLAGCGGSGSHLTKRDVRQARESGYAAGLAVGETRGRKEGLRSAEAKYPALVRLAYRKGERDALGDISYTPGSWYAIRTKDFAGAPGVTVQVPLDNSDLFTVCPNDPSNICGDSIADLLGSSSAGAGVPYTSGGGSYSLPPVYSTPSTTTRDYGSSNGYPVVCADGTLSDSGGVQGACSWHGGVP